MAISLVTGHAGSAHVTSQQMRDLYKGIWGDNAGCILDRVGDALRMSVIDSTHVSIGTGAAIMPDGAYVYNDSPATVGIDAGTANRNRIDVVYLAWSASGGVETARIAVQKGTPTTGAATAPTVPTGALPIRNVAIQGVSIVADSPACPYSSGFADLYGMQDYPIEKYISPDKTQWSFTKWASGKMECYIHIGFGWSGTHAVGTAWGSLYRSTYAIGSNVEYPTPFTEVPNVTYCIDPAGDYSGLVVPADGNPGSASKPGAYWVVRPVSGAVNGYICLRAVGRWK